MAGRGKGEVETLALDAAVLGSIPNWGGKWIGFCLDRRVKEKQQGGQARRKSL